MTGYVQIWTLLCLHGFLGQLLPNERDYQVVKIQQALLESVRTPILYLTESIVQNQLDRCNATISLLETKIHELESRFTEMETRQKDVKIAFYAYISFESAADILKFDRVLLNEGDTYNSSTGIFTCPVNGTYKFTWSVQIQNTDWGHVLVDFKLNGSTKGFTVTFGPKEHTSTNTVILRLTKWDTVWLQKRSISHIRIAAFETSFSGHILYH